MVANTHLNLTLSPSLSLPLSLSLCVCVWNIFINSLMLIYRDLSGNKIVKLLQNIFYDLTALNYL